MECHQQERGAWKGMTGFPLVIQYKMTYYDRELDNLHIKALSYSLILLGTIPLFIEWEDAVSVVSSHDPGNALNKVFTSL